MAWRRTLKFGKNEIQQRFSALSPREQILSAGTIAGIVFYSLYLLIYEPMASEKIFLEQKINVLHQTHQQLKMISEEVNVLRTSHSNPIVDSNAQSVMAVIDATSKQLEISQATKRIIPDGADSVTLWLENIAFDKLILWLAVLETKHAIRIDQISIENQKTKSGIVNAKLLLAK
jgi:general secretion pathway protein M